MKKIVFLFITIASYSYSYSQSLEEQIALKACDCLNKSKEINDEIYRNCISASMSEVVLMSKNKNVRESINTVEGIQSMFLKTNEVLMKSCNKLISEKPASKSDIFYSDSKIESAQNAYIIAKDFMNDKKYRIAIENLQISLKKDPKFVLAYDDIAMCYRQLNDYDNAVKYYKKSLEIFPEGDFALMNIGVVYSLKEDYKTAITYYEKLIEYQPNNAEGYFGAGKSYLQINNDEKALDGILKAHRIYSETQSDYIKDTEMLMGAIYQKMKADNKEDVFKRIAKENNINIE